MSPEAVCADRQYCSLVLVHAHPVSLPAALTLHSARLSADRGPPKHQTYSTAQREYSQNYNSSPVHLLYVLLQIQQIISNVLII